MGTNLEPGASPALSSMEIDAIGEIMNISMGSAATAVSTMLDKQVMITTPNVEVASLGSINSSRLEPAIIVKITYTEGITGSNVMVFRQRDLQYILNGLMGIEEPPTEDFVFDELSMSAACEVMNQMMGASATALSDFLGMPVNISTPTAMVMDENNTFISAVGLEPEHEIVSILFDMSIKDVMHSEFVSILSIDLARTMVGQFFTMTGMDVGGAVEAAPAASAPAPAPAAPAPSSSLMSDLIAPPPSMQQPAPAQPMQQPMQQQPMQQDMMAQQMPMQGMSPQQQMQQMPMQGMPPQQQMQQMPMQGMPPQQQMQQMPMQGMPMMDPAMMGQYYGQYPQQMMGYPPYGYPPMDQGQQRQVRNVQFPEFPAGGGKDGSSVMGGNMDLIMNVPLQVSIEIGSTRRKIKDIMGFTQGTVIELDKQAGAPVDIVVNGELIAHGDVVVIDDNFGVRITEIVGTKELLNALENKK